MPTRSVGRAPYISRALNTVAPPHIRGAAYSLGIESGILKRKASRKMVCEAKEPMSKSAKPYMTTSRQKVSLPVRHCSQWPQVL